MPSEVVENMSMPHASVQTGNGSIKILRDEPPVTWIMPLRDGMPYLREALTSIASQTYRNHKILVWDNGSSDGSLEELRQWIPSRIPGQVISGKPLSLGGSLAAMVEMADTELLARADADDIQYPRRLECQVAFLQSHSEWGLVSSSLHTIDASGNTLEKSLVPPVEDIEIRLRLRFHNCIAHPAAVFRRSMVLKAGNYSEEVVPEDYDLWLRLSCVCRMANLEVPLVMYRQHTKSFSCVHANELKEQVRKVQISHAALCYAGASPRQIMRLIELVRNPDQLNVRWEDVRLLRKIAKQLARSSGTPWREVAKNSYYRYLIKNFLTRYLKAKPVLRSLWPLMRRMYGYPYRIHGWSWENSPALRPLSTDQPARTGLSNPCSQKCYLCR